MISPFSFTRNEIERRVRQAIDKLRERDRYLLAVNASERSIVHHLAVYLYQEFESLNVDVEYNRDEHEVKRLRNLPDVNCNNVLPDVIVHTRGTNDENLLVVEVKKRGSENGTDEMKLIEFTKPLSQSGLGYYWGLHLILNCEAQANDSLRWYKHGASCG